MITFYPKRSLIEHLLCSRKALSWFPLTRDMVFKVAQFSNIPLLFSLCRCVLEKLKAHMPGNTIAQRTGWPAHAVLFAPMCLTTSESAPETGPNLRVLFWGAFLIPYNLKRCFLSVLWLLQFLDTLSLLFFTLLLWVIILPRILDCDLSMSVCLSVCLCVSFLHLLIFGMCGKAKGRCGFPFSKCHTVQWMACAILSLEQSSLLAYLWWLAGHMFFLGF